MHSPPAAVLQRSLKRLNSSVPRSYFSALTARKWQGAVAVDPALVLCILAKLHIVVVLKPAKIALLQPSQHSEGIPGNSREAVCMQRFNGLVTTCTGIGYLTRSFFKAVTASFVNGSSVVPTYRFSRLPGVAP